QNIAALLKRSIHSMRNIINELSEIAKKENDYKEEVETVRLENIFHEVKMTLNDTIIRKKAQVHIDFKEPEVEFPRKNLRSVIYNLLSNAIKYSSPERTPEVLVKSDKVDGQIRISVRDNGIGIAEDKTDLLFLPYSRLERKVEGTGIGLYMVKRIIENEG